MLRRSSVFSTARLGIPPAWQRSQNPPRLKKSKKSLRGGLRGSWPTPRKRVKNESPESQNRWFFWLAESPGDSFLTRFRGVGQDPRRPPRRLSRRLFFDFLSRGGFWLLCQAGGIPRLGPLGKKKPKQRRTGLRLDHWIKDLSANESAWTDLRESKFRRPRVSGRIKEKLKGNN